MAQDEAIDAVGRAIRRARAGLKDPEAAHWLVYLPGPTGVGKSLLAKALAEALFGDEDAMIRIDMSEYMERHTVSRLVGAPPGYVGYEEGGQLTERVRRRPYSVILLDEIEKAHPEVFNILLQVLEDGRLTDAKGRTVDFRNTVIIMTSNVGAHEIQRETGIGFQLDRDEKRQLRVDEEEGHWTSCKRTFRPEFLNRIDEVIVFHALNKEHLKRDRGHRGGVLHRAAQRAGVHIEFTDAAKRSLADKGYDPDYGGRPLRRAIQRYVENPLSEEMLRGTFNEGDTDHRRRQRRKHIVFRKGEMAGRPSVNPPGKCPANHMAKKREGGSNRASLPLLMQVLVDNKNRLPRVF